MFILSEVGFCGENFDLGGLVKFMGITNMSNTLCIYLKKKSTPCLRENSYTSREESLFFSDKKINAIQVLSVMHLYVAIYNAFLVESFSLLY
jgi:hypothetical protein